VPSSAPPRVLAVVVSHDGAAWLPRTLRALLAQRYPNLEVLGVDNASTDDTRQLLFDALSPSRVLLSEEDLGFGAAVSLALDAHDGRMELGAEPAEYVLLLHDDVALASDAVTELVAVLEADPRVAIAGPKLRDWSEVGRLQAVGSTIDATGRVDDGVDIGELDQGQRDEDRRVLYVSTAGMLVRRRVLDELGRFDRRYRAFRDDLDLCWRAWLAGHDTEVVPAAVGHHAAVASDHLRAGRTATLGPRFLAERNTLATLIKCYGRRRLALVLPLALVVGVGKVAGFLLTRRVGDATATVAAWSWNLAQLPTTLRARRTAQAARRRSDAELSDLLGKVTPRVRAYLEAIVAWVAGGDTAIETTVLVDPDADPPSLRVRALALARRRPLFVTGGPLLALLAIGAAPVLLPGSLRGGDLAPWPPASAAFLSAHAASWHDAAGVGTSLPPSPSQALLGLLQLALGGSSYLASRVLLLVPVIVAWVLAVKAAQRFSERRVPRVAAATAYVLSPPALAALTTARVGALVVLALLPGMVAAAATLADPEAGRVRGWRAVAALALLASVTIAFEPFMVVPVVLALVGGLVAALVGVEDRIRRTSLLLRLAVAGLSPALLLAPWSLTLVTRPSPLLAAGEPAVGGALWRWLLLAPGLDGMPGLLAGAGFLLAGVLGLTLGGRRAPRAVAAAWGVALSGGVLAWAVDGLSLGLWAGTPLVLTAAAYAALLAIAFGTADEALSRFALGWRQAVAVAAVVGVATSVATVGVSFAREDWAAVDRGTPALPEFVSATAGTLPARVLVIAERDGLVEWELVDGRGPTMTAFGASRDPAVTTALGAIVGDLTTGADPRAAARLGRLGVRYVVVPEGGAGPGLDRALRLQVALEPKPALSGSILEVDVWVPGAALAAPRAFDARAVPTPRDPQRPVVPLVREAPGRYVVTGAPSGSVVLAEPFDAGWELRVDGLPVSGRVDDGAIRFDDVPSGARLVLTHTGATARSLALAGQVLVLLLVVSLGLRPPSPLGREERR
jgi:GT2 family glycosyltransferase